MVCCGRDMHSILHLYGTSALYESRAVGGLFIRQILASFGITNTKKTFPDFPLLRQHTSLFGWKYVLEKKRR